MNIYLFIYIYIYAESHIIIQIKYSRSQAVKFTAWEEVRPFPSMSWNMLGKGCTSPLLQSD